MRDDRRNSVRRTADLPFAWCEVPADATLADVGAALAVPGAITRAARLAEFEDAFAAALSAVTDRGTASALRALERRLAVLEQAVLADAAQPPGCSVEVSADGIGFDAAEPISAGTTLGMHLVLPTVTHLLLTGRVTYCAELGPARWRVGAEFLDLDDATAKRLTRFAIAR
jgi:hypothetical protein